MIICCDIDGVLADVRKYIKEYLPHDWKTYFAHTLKFPPILPIAELLHSANLRNSIYLVTGRPESNRNETLLWLHRFLPLLDILSPELLMRSDKDPRSGTEIKLEWFREIQPDLIIDDSPDTAKAAAAAGFTVLQVHGFRATPNDMVPEDYILEE
ncbi:hypothetical protein LCGC14_2914390 [marine sediment metagenome]|uniref:Polynucleotide kinase PNKP phosphatase domain-containing protein n=1 Tax=marine sediment metagenome TaxID=412755 RepID=A0A0F8YCI9_9ZZZZ